MGVFKANLEAIRQHNQEYDEGKHTYTMGLNSMADWTIQEFNSRNTYRRSQRYGNDQTKFTYDVTNNDALPLSVNWTEQVKICIVLKCNTCYCSVQLI